jgi:PmbA protein
LEGRAISLLGRDGTARLADAALEGAAGAAAAEVVVEHRWGGLTRFVGGGIHQNVATDEVEVRVRTVTSDGRVGVAVVSTGGGEGAGWGGSGGRGSDEGSAAAEAGATALALARVGRPDPEFPGFAPPAASGSVPVDEATLQALPAERAEAVRAVLAEAGAGGRGGAPRIEGLDAAGSLVTGGLELAVVTTEGQRVYTPLSSARLTLVVTGPTSSGFAESGGRALTDVDAAAAARVAVGKALAGANPRPVSPGRWPVVLAPAATATLVQFLAVLGFGGRGWLEGRAFTSGRLGEQALDPALTVVDDARSPSTIGLPFDWEGTPKQRVVLVDQGVLANVVHDRFTGARTGMGSTGHGLPAPNPTGPTALNPMLVPGDGGAIDDLVGGLERGLLVTRFHYTNVVHPRDTLITGMTRDGTFVVEDGRTTAAVHNLRFTDTILRALAEVDAVSTETGFVAFKSAGTRFPAVRLPGLHFTSATTFG